MQLIVVLCLIAKLALVSGKCDPGKIVKDFKLAEFTGTWYFLYHFAVPHDDNIDCMTLHVNDPVGNVSTIVTYVYDKKSKSEANSAGSLYDWDNTGFTVNYTQDVIWNGRCYIEAIDSKRYAILKFCSNKLGKLLLYVVFRSPRPDQATLKDVQKDLQDNNIDIKQLHSWNTEDCPNF